MSTRPLNVATRTAAAAATVTPVWLVELELAAETVRMWSGIGELQLDGQVWLGTGTLLSVDPAGEVKSGVRSEGTRLSLSGVPQELLSLALLEPYQGRPCRIRVALLDADMALIGQPVPISRGLLDVMTVTDELTPGDDGVPDSATSRLEVSVESRMDDFDRPRLRRWTHEEQQHLYPGDRGLEFVAAQAAQQVRWGA